MEIHYGPRASVVESETRKGLETKINAALSAVPGAFRTQVQVSVASRDDKWLASITYLAPLPHYRAGGFIANH